MTKNNLYKLLSRFVNIKPGEEYISLLFFLYFFLITAPYSIIKSIRNANLLNQLGEKGLPVAYLLTAILIGVIVNFHSKFQEKVPRNVLFISSLLFFLFTCTIFWFLLPYGVNKQWDWMPLAYWIWANIYIAVLVTQFWISVNDIFNPREAKRLIGFWGSGGILGGIVGGMLTGVLAKSKFEDSLLLLAAGMIFGCIFVVRSIFIFRKNQMSSVKNIDKENNQVHTKEERYGFSTCFNAVRKHSYLKLLAGVVTFTVIVSTFIDFQYNAIVKNSMESEDLIAFFGYFTAGMLIFSFFLQILMTPSLLRRFSIKINLLLYPSILLCGSLGIFIWPQILFGVLIKGGDKSLSYSLNQSARELLYIPIPIELKYKAKVFIDMFLNRFAKGIGAIFLLVFVYFNLGVEYVSLMSAIFIFAWVILNIKVSKEYIETVKQNLKANWVRADKLVSKEVDIDYMKMIFDLLESQERSSILYAMYLFDLMKENKLTPDLKRLISMESSSTKISAMGSLIETEHTPYIPITSLTTTRRNYSIEEDIKEIMSSDLYQEVMRGYMDNVLSRTDQTSDISKMEVAKAIGLMDSKSPLSERLDSLLEDDSPEVVKFAIESAARLKRMENVPALIQRLEDPVMKEDARSALVKYGNKIVGSLTDYILDQDESLDIRKGVASILAQIGTKEAVESIIKVFKTTEPQMITEIIDAFDRLQSNNVKISIENESIQRILIDEVKKYFQIFLTTYSTKNLDENLTKNLKILNETLMNIFKLLALIYPREDIFKAYQSLQTGTKRSMDYAAELLDNTLKKEHRDIILPIIEDIPLKSKMRKMSMIIDNLPKDNP